MKLMEDLVEKKIEEGEKSNRDTYGLCYLNGLDQTLAPPVKSPVIVSKLLT